MRRVEMLLVVVAAFLAVIAAPLGIDAAQSDRIYRIGMLERTSAATNATNIDAFRQGMREHGYVVGDRFGSPRR